MATLQAEAVVIYVACFSVGMDNAPASTMKHHRDLAIESCYLLELGGCHTASVSTR